MSPAVEVYNCAMGSPDCSQCLGREDLGHQCVWSDGCRLRGTLQPLPGTCPAPEIRAVSTHNFPFPSEACGTHQPKCAHAQRSTRDYIYPGTHLATCWVPGPTWCWRYGSEQNKHLPSQS